MARYRKKPVVIDALRWTGANIEEMMDFTALAGQLPQAPDDPHITPAIGYTPATGRLTIPTLEGTLTAIPGDWVILGVKRELYPCKPDVFDMTYEEDDG